MQQTIAMTGGTGKTGISLIQYLLKRGYAVNVLVRALPAAGHPLLCEDVALTVLDLATLPERDVQDWLDEVRPLALIHAAALADVPRCERQPELAYLLNACATAVLAKACAYRHIHFVLLSTEYVFAGDIARQQLYHESDQARPLNHYGRSKLEGELATQEACGWKTLWTICRTSMVYGGPHQERPDFVQWVGDALRQDETIQVAVDQINSPTHILDLARMLGAVVEQRLLGIYHIAGSTPVSRYAYACQVARYYGLNEELIQPVLTSEQVAGPRRPLNAALCVDKIIADTGSSPLSLEEGLDLSAFAEYSRKDAAYGTGSSRGWQPRAGRAMHFIGERRTGTGISYPSPSLSQL